MAVYINRLQLTAKSVSAVEQVEDLTDRDNLRTPLKENNGYYLLFTSVIFNALCIYVVMERSFLRLLHGGIAVT